MSNNNLAGFPAFRPRVDSTIIYHPREIVFDPAIELPTSAPATPQLEMTVAASDLPTIAPYDVPFDASDTMAMRYTVYTIASFQNTGAGSATITAQWRSTGTTYNAITAIPTTGAVAAGKYKTITFSKTLTSWSLGDTFQNKFYASAAGVNLLKAYVVILPRKIGSGLSAVRLIDLDISVSGTSLIGAAACTNISNSTNMQVMMPHYTPSSGQASLMAGISNTRNIIPAHTTPLYSVSGTYAFICGVKSMADHSYDYGYWSADSATENLYHLQPFYPTRIAYTPIL